MNVDDQGSSLKNEQAESVFITMVFPCKCYVGSMCVNQFHHYAEFTKRSIEPWRPLTAVNCTDQRKEKLLKRMTAELEGGNQLD